MNRPLSALLALVSGLAALCVLAPSASATPGPANAPEYWFDSWQLTQLWSDGVRGQGQVIAEIDTGVDARLPQLRGRVLPGIDLGKPGNGQVDREVNEFGHGTAMASIMVARPGPFGITGIAPGAKILPVAVPLDGTVDRGLASRDILPGAIRWAADHGADVISMSIGGKRTPDAADSPCPQDEQDAVFHAIEKGAVVVASVGNTGPTRNAVEDPASCLGVVSVGAVDASGQVARFSGRQPYLTLVAPGVSVPSLSRVPGVAYSGDGTSQATAIVSAALALIRSKHPSLSPRAVVTRLLATLDGHRSRPSPAYGYGSLDAYAAVTAKVPPMAPNPVFDLAEPFLERDRAFAAASASSTPVAPAPVAKAAPGRYAVGNVPEVTPRIRTGIALVAAGLLAIVTLLAAAARRGETRGRHAAVAVIARTRESPVAVRPG